MSLLMR